MIPISSYRVPWTNMLFIAPVLSCVFFSYQNGLFPQGGLCCRPPFRCCCAPPPPPFCLCDNTLSLCSFMLANSESRVCGLCLGVAFVCCWAGADTLGTKFPLVKDFFGTGGGASTLYQKLLKWLMKKRKTQGKICSFQTRISEISDLLQHVLQWLNVDRSENLTSIIDQIQSVTH